MSTIEADRIRRLTIDNEEVSTVTMDGVVVWESNGVYQYWTTTSSSYAFDSNWDSIVDTNLGSQWRVADWSELETAFNQLPTEDWNALTEQVWGGSGTFFCYKNGEQLYRSDRAYFASYHGGNPPDYYAQHDQINDSEISLGSWDSNNRIMAVRTDWDVSEY